MSLLELWRKQRKSLIKEVLERHGHRITDAKLNEQVEKEVNKIRYILNEGLDVGGIIKSVVEVELYKYNGEIYFRDKKSKFLYPIEVELKYEESPAKKELKRLLR